MQRTVYRQSFTAIGWIGLALAVICPMALSALWTEKLNATLPFQEPSSFLMTLVATGCLLGPILVLVGREYYAVAAKTPEPAEPPKPGSW